jgi:hypothetical protein
MASSLGRPPEIQKQLLNKIFRDSWETSGRDIAGLRPCTPPLFQKDPLNTGLFEQPLASQNEKTSRNFF